MVKGLLLNMLLILTLNIDILCGNCRWKLQANVESYRIMLSNFLPRTITQNISASIYQFRQQTFINQWERDRSFLFHKGNFIYSTFLRRLTCGRARTCPTCPTRVCSIRNAKIEIFYGFYSQRARSSSGRCS